MAFGNVGRVWGLSSFREHFESVNTSWAKSVTLHHTSSPSLLQRPKGLIKQHIHNIKYFYKVKLGWSRGPHLFIDEDEIFGMSEMHERGVHAKSFNHDSIGIEVLGDYDSEDPKSGRGIKCWKTAAKTVAIMYKKMGITPNKHTIKFHRDDPQTNKSCPGRLVSKDWFVDLVCEELEIINSDKITSSEPQESNNESLKRLVASIEWQLDKLKKQL